MNTAKKVAAVLFDLDGTLLDTAADLAFALNTVREARGLPQLTFAAIRPYVSHGSFALTRIGFGAAEGSAEFEQFRLDLLACYAQNIARETRLFEGMPAVLDYLHGCGLPWGIVTNKPAWLTTPLLRAVALDQRAATVVSGDTLAEKKPHPAPLLFAAQQLETPASQCVYIGDAKRDIDAGRAAGMYTLTALYGYITQNDTPEAWGADATVKSADAIGRWLRSALS